MSDIFEIIQKQDDDFYARVGPEKLKQAKTIIIKYNWKNPMSLISLNNPDFEKFKEALDVYLKKREEVLKLFAEYL